MSSKVLSINHLIYADDILLFFKVDLESCNKFKKLFEDFGKTSGLIINANKSNISFSPNTPNHFKKMLCKASKFKMVNCFNKYLGSFVDEKAKSRKVFGDMHEKLQKKAHKVEGRFVVPS